MSQERISTYLCVGLRRVSVVCSRRHSSGGLEERMAEISRLPLYGKTRERVLRFRGLPSRSYRAVVHWMAPWPFGLSLNPWYAIENPKLRLTPSYCTFLRRKVRSQAVPQSPTRVFALRSFPLYVWSITRLGYHLVQKRHFFRNMPDVILCELVPLSAWLFSAVFFCGRSSTYPSVRVVVVRDR